jgi:hypothetical protein
MAAKGPRPSLVRCSGQLAASQGDQWLASRRRRTLWYRLGVGGHLPRPGHCQSGATAAGAAVVSRRWHLACGSGRGCGAPAITETGRHPQRPL